MEVKLTCEELRVDGCEGRVPACFAHLWEKHFSINLLLKEWGIGSQGHSGCQMVDSTLFSFRSWSRWFADSPLYCRSISPFSRLLQKRGGTLIAWTKQELMVNQEDHQRKHRTWERIVLNTSSHLTTRKDMFEPVAPAAYGWGGSHTLYLKQSR